jgi:hypothetical protein
MLVQLLGYDPAGINKPGQPGYGAGSGAPAVMLAYVKHLWATGDRKEALSRWDCWLFPFCEMVPCVMSDQLAVSLCGSICTSAAGSPTASVRSCVDLHCTVALCACVSDRLLG